jgi:excisionase family DNA binding protein
VKTYTVTEASAILRVHRNTLCEWLAGGKVRGFRAGSRGHWRIPADSLAGLGGSTDEASPEPAQATAPAGDSETGTD